MKYAKPEVLVLARAVEAIQGSDVKPGSFLDAVETAGPAISPAYDLDE